MAAELPFVDMPVYLAWLTARIAILGGRIEQQVVSSLDEIINEHADSWRLRGTRRQDLASDTSAAARGRGGHAVIVDAPGTGIPLRPAR